MKDLKYIFVSVLLLFSFLLYPFHSMVLASDPVFGWAKQIGSTDYDTGYSIAVDSDGNVYTAGIYHGTVDFDPGPGTTELTALGDYEVFISKTDTDGNFVWAKSIGGTGYDDVSSISLDADNNIYFAGSFEGTVDFDPGVGTTELTSAGQADVYVEKLDSDGNFVWVKQLGGTGYQFANFLNVDHDGNVYTVGVFENTVDFDPGAGTEELTSAGGYDIFISKLDSDGNFVWVRQALENVDSAGARSIAIDSTNNVYIAGYFEGIADLDPGAGTEELTSLGNYDAFISKFDSNGNFVWVKQIGGAQLESVYSIVFDSDDNLYTNGYFNGTVDFDPGVGVEELTSVGQDDIVISKFDTDGNFVWAKQIGGTGDDVGYSIDVDDTDNLYLTGYFEGTVDFDPGTGTSNLTALAGDGYILKLDSDGEYLYSGQFTGDSVDSFVYPYVIKVGDDNSIYTTGEFYETADFDPTEGVLNLTELDDNGDVFISKLTQVVDPVVTPPEEKTYGTTRVARERNLQNNIQDNVAPTPITPETTKSNVLITKNLKYNMRDDEVKLLQQYLNTHNYPLSLSGPGSLNNETTYFGSKTKAAVMKFQKVFNLLADGVVGPLTRAVLK